MPHVDGLVLQLLRTPHLALILLLGLVAPPLARAQTGGAFDVVIANGQVMDPESGLDAVRHVGIRSGKIAALSERPLTGRQVINAAGLVVAPGFIDLHAHGQDLFSSRLQAQDGVTTALELEGGTGEVAEWYARREGKAVIHYGATASHSRARRKVLGGDSAATYAAATPEQLAEIERTLDGWLDEGALGLGFGIAYTPGARREEITPLFGLAARRGVTNFVHVRYGGMREPESSTVAIQEVIANAATTGASVHVVHIGSSGLHLVPTALEMIDGARKRGLDVTTEVYPYTAASTAIQSAIFDSGWRERLAADYGDIEWVATGERLDSTSFRDYRRRGGIIVAHIIPESAVEAALSHPGVMVASDGVPFIAGRAHPRGAGSFARVLGRYVRERQTLPLMEALRRMTLLPAQRLEAAVPAMRDKGRIRVGADADITVFDPATVIDRATFAEPARPSAGIAHVLVGGTLVVRDGRLVEDAFPGRAVRRKVSRAVAAGFAPPPAPPSGRSAELRVDSVFADLQGPISPGCAVGVYRAGELLYARGYGMADLERGVPITPRTVFNIGSVSKQFTAAALVLLEQQGKLSLDDDVRRHLPELPEYPRPVTLRQLVHHQSGLRDPFGAVLLAGRRPHDLITTGDLLEAAVRLREPNFAPDEDFQYNTGAYALLSEVVRRASGTSLREYTAERVFAPLGMAATRFHDRHTDLVPGRALAYESQPDGSYGLDMPQSDFDGATGLHTTVEDLAHWDGNFYAPVVGGARFAETMYATGRLGDGGENRYAFGLSHGLYRALPTIGHSGADGGYRSYSCASPSRGSRSRCSATGPTPRRRGGHAAWRISTSGGPFGANRPRRGVERAQRGPRPRTCPATPAYTGASGAERWCGWRPRRAG
jgi:CubicO group peptidase (beta-lactamase class C family)/N-acyl-D-aspartate/D-glutamate deacylase